MRAFWVIRVVAESGQPPAGAHCSVFGDAFVHEAAAERHGAVAPGRCVADTLARTGLANIVAARDRARRTDVLVRASPCRLGLVAAVDGHFREHARNVREGHLMPGCRPEVGGVRTSIGAGSIEAGAPRIIRFCFA